MFLFSPFHNRTNHTSNTTTATTIATHFFSSLTYAHVVFPSFFCIVRPRFSSFFFLFHFFFFFLLLTLVEYRGITNNFCRLSFTLHLHISYILSRTMTTITTDWMMLIKSLFIQNDFKSK